MVPVVVPAVLEYVMPLRVWLEWVVLVAASWCWHTVGSWNSRHPDLRGLGLLFLVSVSCEAGLVGWWMGCGLLFENCIVDASILFFCCCIVDRTVPPGVVCEVW